MTDELKTMLRRKALAFFTGTGSLIVFLFLLTISALGIGHYGFGDLAVYAFRLAVQTSLSAHIVVVSLIGGAAAVLLPDAGDEWNDPWQMPQQIAIWTASCLLLMLLILGLAFSMQVLTGIVSVGRVPPNADYVLPKRACNARDLAKATFQLYHSRWPAHVAVAVLGPEKPDAAFKQSLARIMHLAAAGHDYSSFLPDRSAPLPEADLRNLRPIEAVRPPEQHKLKVYRVLFLQGTQVVSGRNTSVWADGVMFTGFKSAYQRDVERAIDREPNSDMPLIAVGHSLGGMVADRVDGLRITFGSPFDAISADKMQLHRGSVRAFAIKGDLIPIVDWANVPGAIAKRVTRSLMRDRWRDVLFELVGDNVETNTTWLPNNRTFFQALVSPFATHMQYADNSALEGYGVFGEPSSGTKPDCLWFVSHHPIGPDQGRPAAR